MGGSWPSIAGVDRGAGIRARLPLAAGLSHLCWSPDRCTDGRSGRRLMVEAPVGEYRWTFDRSGCVYEGQPVAWKGGAGKWFGCDGSNPAVIGSALSILNTGG